MSNKAKTDDSKLVTTDTVYVSPDGGTTDEPFPKPNVEYDFCVDVANAGELPSGSFFVRFTLSGDQDPPLDSEKSINCAGSFGIVINTESASDSGSASSDDTPASDSSDGSSDSTGDSGSGSSDETPATDSSDGNNDSQS